MTTPATPAPKKRRLIGHDYVVIKKTAEGIWRRLTHGTMATNLWETLDGRGFAFEIRVMNDQGQPTGHIARVQVTLDRFEMPPPK